MDFSFLRNSDWFPENCSYIKVINALKFPRTTKLQFIPKTTKFSTKGAEFLLFRLHLNEPRSKRRKLTGNMGE